MPGQSRPRTVVLTLRYSSRASYYRDWEDAFAVSPLFNATIYNIFRRAERRAAQRAIEEAELIIALHSCSADTLQFLEPLAMALEVRRGRFLMLVGNEYNLPWIGLGEKRDFLRRVDADFVGTQMLREAGEWLYADTGAKVIAVPHALNEAVFRRERPDGARPIDIGGRSARYPVYVGDDERNRIHDYFRELGPAADLRVDIDTQARLNRPGWAAFLNRCKATIGTEAGSWYIERDDRTVREIEAFLRERSGRATIRANGFAHRSARHLPYLVKSGLRALLGVLPLRHQAIGESGVDPAEIEARFFAARPRCPAYSKCISSRHFDAAGTGTCQILVRGRYNDILRAGEHYIALDPDLKNAPEAIERFRDRGERARVAEAARELVAGAHTYRHRIASLYEETCRRG